MMKIEGVVVLLSFFIVCQAACPDTYKSAWVRTVGNWPKAKDPTLPEWDPANSIGLMTFQESTCSYKSDKISGLPPYNQYFWKVTTWNTWNENYGCPGDCPFVVPASGEVFFHFNYFTKQMSVENVGGGTTPTTPAPTPPPSTPPPASGSGKQVVAHFMMGNTYGYTQQLFQNDMNLAKKAGIDAFALNIGLDSWSNDRTQKAYDAAVATGFKVFLSFDMVYWGASATAIIDQVKRFGKHAGQYKYNNKIFVSTFGGSGKNMGYATDAAAWSAIKSSLNSATYPIFLVPNFAVNPTTIFNTYSSFDGAFSWGAWPSPNSAVADDNLFMTAANNAQKVYMAPWSPLFYAHLQFSPTDFKNYLYDYDGLWFSRWQQLLSINPHMIEIITWNDWGEAHYIAPIDPNPGNLPSGSADYVNGFDHSFLLETLPYFISYYKTGVAPTVTKDIVVYWYRPHPAKATATSDPIARPRLLNQYMADNNYDLSYLSDHVFVLTILRSPGTIQVNSGGVITSKSVPAGASMYSTPMSSGIQTVSLSRTSQVCSHTGSVQIKSSPTKYNYNIYVGGCLSN